MKNAALLALLLAMAVHTAGGQAVPGMPQPVMPAPPAGCRAAPMGPDLQALVDFSGKLPLADYQDAVLACTRSLGLDPTLPATPSAWLESERHLYQKALAAQRVDVLVLPLQVQGYGLDRIERALMTADLAYSLGETGQYKVADPFLTARALGEGRRRFELLDVSSLADQVGASRVVWGYVGHDRHHGFTLTLQVDDRTPAGSGKRKWQHDWRQIAFTDEQTPALVFHQMLPEVLAQLPLGLKARPRKRGTSSASKIPVAPSELPSSAGTPAPPASLTLLAALSAPAAELSSERLFERALLTTLREGKQANAFLQAYSLMNLSRRPSALAAIADQHSPQAEALRALLDGNLPGAKSAIGSVSDSLERLLLQISLRDLEATYRRKLQTQPAATAGVFAAAATQWEPFVELRARVPDEWAVDPPLAIKALLDRTLPVSGMDTNALLRGTAAARAEMVDDVDVDIAIARHIRRAAEIIPVAACCVPASQRITQWDLLSLLEGLAEARMKKSFDVTTNLQGLAQSTIERLARYDSLFSGHPMLEWARADASIDIMNRGAPDTKASSRAQLYRSGQLAAQWLPGQNRIAAASLMLMGYSSRESMFMVDAYGYDYPRRPYWPNWTIGFEGPFSQRSYELAVEALAFSSTSIEPLSQFAPGDTPGRAGAVWRSLGQRFMGHPNRPLNPQDSFEDQSKPADRVAQLKAAIEADPEVWSNYQQLADLTLRSGGSYDEVSRIFLAYPGFREREPQDAVALSNQAYEAGSLLYWQGMSELAKPFYKIAADLNTGSSASMTSEQRLQILDGDYMGATSVSFDRARRYESPHAYRDFLSFLYVLGEGEQAWDAFGQLNSAFDNPQVWLAALVGHDREGMTARQIQEWLKRPEIQSSHFGTRRFASYYAVLWSSTEHAALPGLGRFVEQIEGPPVARMNANEITAVVPNPTDPTKFEYANPSPLRAPRSPHLPSGTPVKSELAYFADAYAAVRARDYGTAATRFIAMADRYPIETYPLPYFAYAASKTGDTEKLEKYIDDKKLQGFDASLARAFFAAGRKDAQAARNALQQALRERPHTDYRPILTEYQYAEACEWLYKDTGDARFRDDLLDWVRKYQKIVPTFAWAYAMQYTYEQPGAARTRALAITRYLSPAAERIRGASKQELVAADKWFQQNNPFRVSEEPRRVAKN